jgi:hypothetical protein
MSMHLDPGRYVIRVDIQSLLELSRSHVFRYKETEPAGSL